ncbi:MAG: hypothetical protein A2V77_22865 [Anaeromyxobacter sp. RBG_16_69_14]|nr:MAG: hypothetical protein A2V77_22865 [Anaeromyxobacter sp. RBG_16_69_14]
MRRHFDILIHMKSISLSVSEQDYDAFRKAAQSQERPIASLIREAMAAYRAERLEGRGRLEEIVVLTGHAPLAPLPSREELYDEAFDAPDDEERR